MLQQVLIKLLLISSQANLSMTKCQDFIVSIIIKFKYCPTLTTHLITLIVTHFYSLKILLRPSKFEPIFHSELTLTTGFFLIVLIGVLHLLTTTKTSHILIQRIVGAQCADIRFYLGRTAVGIPENRYTRVRLQVL